jgi:hypothetical protein
MKTDADTPGDSSAEPVASGWRGHVGSFVRGHRLGVSVTLGAGAVLFVFLLVWFQPWKLIVDETVDESAPSLATPPTRTATSSPAPQATTLSTGAFRSLEHETTGTAKIIELADGSRIVRLEDLDTSNGPDLVVLLSDTPATEDSWGAYDDGATAYLGKLKGNKGNQNYAIPDDVDLSRFRSVVVWCRRFTVGFGAAPIESA